MTLGLMLPHRRFKTVTRDQLENLAKDAAYSFQGQGSAVEWIRSFPELNQRTRGFTLTLANSGNELDWSVKLAVASLENESYENEVRRPRGSLCCLSAPPSSLFLNPSPRSIA